MLSTQRPLPGLLVLWLIFSFSSIALAVPRDVSHSTSVEARLGYLDKLLHSRSGQRLKEHENGTTYLALQSLFLEAQTAITEGNDDKASKLAKEGFSRLTNAIRALPNDDEEISRQKRIYDMLSLSARKLVFAEEDRRSAFAEETNTQGYDQAHVEQLIDSAEAEAKTGAYESASNKLRQVVDLVTSSIRGVMNNRTVVVELDISTPQKEYFYEIRRYQGYEELIPIAIDVKKPNAMVIEMMLKAQKKSQWMADQAREKVIEEDYPMAIRMMMDATMVIKSALRLVGVNM